jgi:hypothetical protein
VALGLGSLACCGGSQQEAGDSEYQGTSER